MRRIALVVFTVGSLAMAGQAMAGGRYGGGYHGGGYHGGGYHRGGGGGNVAAALFGGAILGVVAGSLISNANNREVVVERSVYVEPSPVYVERAPVYVEPAPCYDSYRGIYVQCDAASYAPPPVTYREPPRPSSQYYDNQPNYSQRQDAPPRSQQNAQQYQESQYREPQYQEQQYQAPIQSVRAPDRQPIPSVYADGARPVGDRFSGPTGGR